MKIRKTINKKTEVLTDQSGSLKEAVVLNKEFDLNDKELLKKSIAGHLIAAIDLSRNDKTTIMECLLDNMNSKNEVNLNQREIALETGISLQTVNKILKSLTSENVLKKENRNYVLNEQIVSALKRIEKTKRLCIDFSFSSNSENK